MPKTKPINVSEQIKPLDNKVNEPKKIEGWQLQRAPQRAITASDGFAFGVTNLTLDEVTHFQNMQTQIDDLIRTLKNLNLTK